MVRTLRILSKIPKQIKLYNKKKVVVVKSNDKKLLGAIQQDRLNNYPVDIDKINNKDIFLL